MLIPPPHPYRPRGCPLGVPARECLKEVVLFRQGARWKFLWWSYQRCSTGSLPRWVAGCPGSSLRHSGQVRCGGGLAPPTNVPYMAHRRGGCLNPSPSKRTFMSPFKGTVGRVFLVPGRLGW